MDSIAGNQPMSVNERPSFRLRLRRINAVDLVVLLAVAYCAAFWSALVANPDNSIVAYIQERTEFTVGVQQTAFVAAAIGVFFVYLLTGEAAAAGIALVPGSLYTGMLVWRSLTRPAAHTSTYAVTAFFMWCFLFAAILIANRYQALQEYIAHLVSASKEADTHE